MSVIWFAAEAGGDEMGTTKCPTCSYGLFMSVT